MDRLQRVISWCYKLVLRVQINVLREESALMHTGLPIQTQVVEVVAIDRAQHVIRWVSLGRPSWLLRTERVQKVSTMPDGSVLFETVSATIGHDS